VSKKHHAQHEPEHPDHEGGTDLERIIFFSDAVIAIAITLLVLDIRVGDIPPKLNSAALAAEIGSLVPRIMVYALSFVVVAIYWITHHRIFRYIRRYDAGLIWINIFFLLVLAFIPVPTSLLASYGDESLPVALYAGTLGLVGLLADVVWWYASQNHRLVDPDLDPHLIRYQLVRGIVPTIVFFASIPLAFVSANAAEFFWLLMLVILLFYRRYRPAERAANP